MPIHKIERRDVTVRIEDWDCSDVSFCMEHGPFPSSWSLHTHGVEETDGKFFVTWERYVAPYHIETAKVEVHAPVSAKEVKRG